MSFPSAPSAHERSTPFIISSKRRNASPGERRRGNRALPCSRRAWLKRASSVARSGVRTMHSPRSKTLVVPHIPTVIAAGVDSNPRGLMLEYLEQSSGERMSLRAREWIAALLRLVLLCCVCCWLLLWLGRRGAAAAGTG